MQDEFQIIQNFVGEIRAKIGDFDYLTSSQIALAVGLKNANSLASSVGRGKDHHPRWRLYAQVVGRAHKTRVERVARFLAIEAGFLVIDTGVPPSPVPAAADATIKPKPKRGRPSGSKIGVPSTCKHKSKA
ncbi:hypothetical protein THIX_30848 [Thiomonas sp. X19]|uniref:hypothetical protein n=1 Tax=Thiomonas sp. X19 TaxID=1050370 RepID=UPI000B691A97|nr:hypothetical protein [Thiomonas sp. X19]SCC93620.1 hypothetical protein THIX_30848 [Thiomonas sp. X19]